MLSSVSEEKDIIVEGVEKESVTEVAATIVEDNADGVGIINVNV